MEREERGGGLGGFLKEVTIVVVGALIASTLLQSPENQTLAVGLYRYVSEQTNSNWPVFAAGAVLSAIPVMALFLYLQKYIVAGLTAGSVK